jgi:hypothetical protein
MSGIRSYLAYGWALLATPLVLVTFMGMDPLKERFVAITGLHVHPLYTGGEQAQTLDHGSFQTIVHRPVFDGLIGQRRTGFVQIQWQPKDANLPDSIDEQIDYDQDGKPDLEIHLDTRTDQAKLGPSDGRVLSVGEVIRVRNGRVARVNLRRRAD